MTDADAARFAAETVQKVYLGVGPVLNQDEARDIVRRAGAVLGDNPPTKDDPAPVDEQKPEEAA